MLDILAEGYIPDGFTPETWGEVLVQAFYFDKHFNKCYEYEDAFVFENTRKRHGNYNPVVFTKTGPFGMDTMPIEIYQKTQLLQVFNIPKQSWNY